LLQLADEVARTFGPVVYVSGEESVQQLKLRAQRLGIPGDRLLVLAETDLEAIIEQVMQLRPMLAAIDSIQALYAEGVSCAPVGLCARYGSRGGSGNVVHVALEGTRPLLVELQSLVSPTAFGLPRRSANGVELNRLHMLLAILEKRARIGLGEHDVFVNAAGG